MALFKTLSDFLEELMRQPGEIIAHVSGKSGSVYIPETEEFLFLDGAFSGPYEENNAELQRILGEMGY